MKFGPLEINWNKKDKNDLILAYVIEIWELCKRDGVKISMALNPEVGAFRDAVLVLLNKIAADIQRILNKPVEQGLSDEDRAALQGIVDLASQVDAVVPEPPTE